MKIRTAVLSVVMIVFAAILMSGLAYSVGAGKDKKLAFLDYVLPTTLADKKGGKQ
ncbi:MAG: hypothetical protein NUV34_11555 [Sulfuricaulis sp.]|nr:hypothetical protein [Sulfuricaulis sp.]